MNGLNPLQMLLQSQQQGQFNAARAGMPGTGYGQNMSMAPQPSMSPVSPVPPAHGSGPGAASRGDHGRRAVRSRDMSTGTATRIRSEGIVRVRL